MLWLILYLSTVLIGFQIVPFFKITSIDFLSRICVGWLLGSLGCGSILYITTYFIPLNRFHSILLTSGVVALNVFIYYRNKLRVYSLQFERNVWFYVYFFFTASFSLKYLSNMYRDAPDILPSPVVPIFDNEFSFIYSAWKGCNRRRLLPFFFKNPLASNYHYSGYVVPLLYTPSLISLGANYSDASILISFMNIFCTIIGVYHLSKRYGQWYTLTSFLFFFSGSWATFFYFRGYSRLSIESDYIHTLSPRLSTVWYHPLLFFLTFSKSASFAIASAQFSILLSPSILSLLLAFITPSSMTSFSLFAFILSLPNPLNSITPIIKFLPYLIFKFIPFVCHFQPFFREAQMNGVFYSHFVIWILSIGPPAIILLFFGWKFDRSMKSIVLALLGPFLLLHFIREGRDFIGNDVAFISVFLLPALAIFVDLLRRFQNWPDDLEYKGCFQYLIFMMIVFLSLGTFFSAKKMELMKIKVIGEEEREAAAWIKEAVKKSEVIFVKPKLIHPASLVGRQLFIGDIKEVWNSGAKLSEKIELYSNLIKSSSIREWKKTGIHFIMEDINDLFNLSYVNISMLQKNSKYQLSKIEY